jgi:hypothetical protein
MTLPADTKRDKNHRFPSEIISHGVWLSYRFTLSYRDVEELLFERGITVSHEAIRQWCRKFGQAYANQLRHRRPRPGDTWHLEIVFTPWIKRSGLTTGRGWHDVAYRHRIVVDEPTIDPECHPGAFLRTCGFGSSSPYALTTRFEGGHHARSLALPRALAFSLLLLPGQPRLCLCPCLAPPLILGSWDPLHQIRFGQALKLRGQSRLRFAQRLFARL